MRLPCPLCGERDRREFYYVGVALDRPETAAWDGAWHAYLHLRENPAGWRGERWFHEAGCGAWIEVERHTTSHEVRGARLSAEGGASEGALPSSRDPGEDSGRDGGEGAPGGRSPGEGRGGGHDGGRGSRGGADRLGRAPVDRAGGSADGGADGGPAGATAGDGAPPGARYGAPPGAR